MAPTTTAAVALKIATAFLAGIALGWAYFQSLWHAVQRIPEARRPGLTMASGFVARLALALGVLFLIMRWGSWQALLAALAGIVVARTVVVRRTRSRPPEDRP